MTCRDQLKAANATIASQAATIELQAATIDSLEAQLASADATIADLNLQVVDLEATIVELESQLGSSGSSLTDEQVSAALADYYTYGWNTGRATGYLEGTAYGRRSAA